MEKPGQSPPTGRLVMSDKLLGEMTPEEFEGLLETFITREEGEIEASTFFQVWAQIEAKLRSPGSRGYLRSLCARKHEL
jgi:hypothetical protein